MRLLLLLASLVSLVPSASASEATYLYKAKLVQAAPGKLLEVIDLYKASLAGCKDAGDEPPLWMRHSQGDHWDLLFLIPMKSYSDYYSPDRVTKRKQAQLALKGELTRLDDSIAWQEEGFVYGPPLDEMKKAFASAFFFHVEMFHSLAGKQSELFKEREMENSYQRTLKRPENLIFVRDQGAGICLRLVRIVTSNTLRKAPTFPQPHKRRRLKLPASKQRIASDRTCAR